MTNPHLRDLLSCPFCDSKALSADVRTHTGSDGRTLYQGFIDCYNCGAHGPATAWYSTKEAALAMVGNPEHDNWNTRAPTAEVERLKEGLRRIAKDGYGLQGLVEDGEDTPEKVAEYYRSEVTWRRQIARTLIEGNPE